MSSCQRRCLPFWALGAQSPSSRSYFQDVKLGVEEANMVAFRFNTIGVSDGISMGTDGMSYSVQSREIIADSIETVRPLKRLLASVTPHL